MNPPSLTLAQFAVQARSLARMLPLASVRPFSERFGFPMVKMIHFWETEQTPEQAVEAIAAGRQSGINPVELAAGDVLDFGWGNRVAIRNLTPADSAYYEPIDKQGALRHASHQFTGWSGTWQWRGFEELAERIERPDLPPLALAQFSGEVHTLDHALTDARNALIGHPSLARRTHSERALKHYWSKGFTVKATVIALSRGLP